MELNNERWIKNIDFTHTILFLDYINNKYFIPAADVLLDNDIDKYGKKKRNKVIKFLPKINENDFENQNEWIYILFETRVKYYYNNL